MISKEEGTINLMIFQFKGCLYEYNMFRYR